MPSPPAAAPELPLNPPSTDEPPSALTFPTSFPIKIMGRRTDGFAQAMVEVVLKHAPDYDPATLEMRASREGNYLSVTVTINATSREQLDNLYRELTGHAMVTMVL